MKRGRCKVNVYNEWDPLQEIIVGIANNAKYPQQDFGLLLNRSFDDHTFPRIDIRSMPKITRKIIQETNEDLEIFVRELKKKGIIVKRPNPMSTRTEIKTPHWKTKQYFNYCPRDTMIALGDTIIETANVDRSRYFETFSYRDILVDYLNSGCKWVCAPKPRLRKSDYNLKMKPKVHSAINNLEPIFDAANVLRAGEDLFYLISNSGNKMGYKWLKNNFGDQYRIHACPNLYSGVHIDSTITLLRPGLALVNPSRVNNRNLPKPLKKWDIIKAPKMKDMMGSKKPTLSSPWLGMNFLMINPNLAVVDSNQKDLIKLLAKHNIDVLALELRHGRLLGGGFHCVTLDVRRKGKKKNYF